MSTESTQTIEEIASTWLMRRDSGRWSDPDQAEFDAWLRASTLNRVAYLRLELGWEDARRLKALGAGVPGDDPPPPGQWTLTPFFEPERAAAANLPETRRAWKVPRRRLLALAATVLLAVTGGWVYWSAGTSYATPVGGISSVPMEDGSKVTLNTDSRVKIAVTEHERRIELKRGEAFFEVAQDEQRPFVVRVGEHQVVVLGTRFSVRRDDEAIQVIVTEGRVRVDGAKDEAPVLEAGARARVTGYGIAMDSLSALEAEEMLAWRTGVLMFRNQALSEAIAEFNRYNVRKLIINDAALGTMKIEGNFRATNFDGFARLLEEAYPVRLERQARDRWLIRSVKSQ